MRSRSLGVWTAIALMAVTPGLQAAGGTGAEGVAARLGEAGEDLVDVFLASPFDAAKAAAEVKRMRSDLSLLRPRAAAGTGEEAVFLADYLLDTADRETASRNPLRAALAVNELTLVLTPLQSFPTAKDRDVALLDYLGREIVLLNRLPAGHDSSTLTARRAAVSGIWTRQRNGFAAIPAAHGTVAAMDQCVKQVQAGGNASAQIAAGNLLLDLVDELERF